MIRSLFFDLDDTLLDFHTAERNALTHALTQMEVVPTDALCIRYSAINAALWRKLERGEITRSRLLCERFERLYAELGVERDADRTQRYYETALSGQYAAVAGARETLDALYGSYRLFIVTNGTADIQHKRIQGAGLARYFERIFISQEIGYEKPSRAFFDACFAACPSLVRAETMIIGDSLSSDMRGGMDAGLITCRYNPRGAEQPADIRIDYDIRTLEEVISICRSGTKNI